MSSAQVRHVSGRLLAAIMVAMTANWGEFALAVACARWMILRGGAWVHLTMAPLVAVIHASRLHQAPLSVPSQSSRALFGSPSAIRIHLQGLPR